MRLRAAVLTVAAVCAWAQTAGTRAVVIVDSAPVYAKMTTEGEPVATLQRGISVTIGMVLFGDETTWCLIQRPGETKRLGYVSCEMVGPEAAPAASTPVEPQAVQPAPQAEPPKAELPKPAPKAVIRDVPATPLKVREVTPVDLSRAKAAAALPPDPPAPKPAPVQVEPPPRAIGAWAVDESGLTGLFGAYVRSTSIISFLDKSRLEEIETELLRQLIAKHFTGAAFVRGTAASLTADQESMHAAGISRWLDQPAAKANARLLRHATRPAARTELVAFAEKLKRTPPEASRLRLIHRLWDATRSSDTEVDATLSIVKATAMALNPILPASKQFTEPALVEALDKVRDAYRPVMKNARVVLYLFAFESASDAELEAYVTAWESPAGQWFAGRVRDGVAASAGTVARNLTVEIGRRAR